MSIFNNLNLSKFSNNKFSKSNNLYDKGIFVGIDWITFIITLILVSIGLSSIYSSSPETLKQSLLIKQLLSVLIGTILLIITIYLPKNFLKTASIFLFIVSILLLIGVLVYGAPIKGTKGWIRLGGFSLQPSEVAKLTTLLLIARYLSQRGTDIRTIRNSFITLMITILPVSLIFLQPDIGSATVILSMLLGILFWTGFEILIIYLIIASPFVIILSLASYSYMIISTVLFSLFSFVFKKRLIFTLFIVGVFVILGFMSPIIYENLMPHQQNRIQSFINPGLDPRGSGYNVWQSILAVGSGGVAGKGYMKGTLTQLKYIPEQWTDFIFSVTAEEFGFIGAVIVVSLQIYLIIRIFNVAYNIDDKFYSIVCFGIATIFLYHCLINIGMVIGLSPVMGIPLPFMSYGGSAIIINLIMIGLVLNAQRYIIVNRKS